jgi:cobaltochelatase CobT
MESAQASASDTFDEDGEMGDDETPGEATRPNSRGANEPRGRISRLRAEIRRVIAAEDLCDHDELERLRAYPRQAARTSAGRRRRLANRLQRR